MKEIDKSDIAAALTEVSKDDTTERYVINPDSYSTRFLLQHRFSHPTTLVVSEECWRDIQRDFASLSVAAETVENGNLTIKTSDELPQSSYALIGSTQYTFIDTGEELYVGEDTPTNGLRDYTEEVSAESQQVSPNTPMRGVAMTSLSNNVEEDVVGDFEDVLEEFDFLDPDVTGIGPVETVILLGGLNESLLYELSNWGEDTGFASKATFSRAKKRLEKNNLIDSVKVPVLKGRPRLRLRLPATFDRESDAVETVRLAIERFDR